MTALKLSDRNFWSRRSRSSSRGPLHSSLHAGGTNTQTHTQTHLLRSADLTWGRGQDGGGGGGSVLLLTHTVSFLQDVSVLALVT